MLYIETVQQRKIGQTTKLKEQGAKLESDMHYDKELIKLLPEEITQLHGEFLILKEEAGRSSSETAASTCQPGHKVAK